MPLFQFPDYYLMHGKSSELAGRSGGRGAGAPVVATKEQLRVAQITQDGQDEDRSRIQKMIKEIIETTRCSQSVAEIALHDASNNVEAAVNNILESTNLDTWSHYKRKGPKSKEEQQREESARKSGGRPPRRDRQHEGGGQASRRGGPRPTENGSHPEARENRQPRDARGPRAGGPRRGGDAGGAPRRGDANKPTAAAESKEEGEDLWKNGPLVFNRRDNNIGEESAQQPQPQQQSVAEPAAAAKPVSSQPPPPPLNPNRPLSFAEVVRKNAAPKPAPPPPAPTAAADTPAYNKLTAGNEAKSATPSPRATDELSAAEDESALAEPSKSPRHHHQDVDASSAGGLLRDDTTFGGQASSSTSQQQQQQSLTDKLLTDKLKNDLGLGGSASASGGGAGAFGTSPPKKYHEPKVAPPPAIKSGVVEFVSGGVPAIPSSDEWQFGFDASTAATAHTQQPPVSVAISSAASVISAPSHHEEPQYQHHQQPPQQQQQQRESAPKAPEPQRSELNLSSNVNEPSAPQRNASTILNQYVQQQQQQQQPSSQPPPMPYGAGSHQPQQQQYNRNRNGVGNLPFSDNYSSNFNPDLRYAASPPKSQNVQQQPLQSLASQQQLPSQTQQPPHHQQQQIFPTAQLPYGNYPYLNMYSPVAHAGLRDDFPPILPYQLNQFDLNALTLFPHLAAVTSAGPMPGHQTQHHQNSNPHQQSNQQSMPPQHNQSNHNQQPPSHQRNDHYSDMSKFLSNQMNIPPGSQQSGGSNGHGSQQNSNLGNNQQRQQLLDNNAQGSLTGNVPPPPGFTAPPNNIGPFMPAQRNVNMFQPSFQVPTFAAAPQFPYVMPSAQHKSK